MPFHALLNTYVSRVGDEDECECLNDFHNVFLFFMTILCVENIKYDSLLYDKSQGGCAVLTTGGGERGPAITNYTVRHQFSTEVIRN